MNDIFNYKHDYINHYVKIVRKNNNQIICQGLVKSMKLTPCECISMDNKFFFPIESDSYDFIVSEIPLKNILILDDIRIYPWSDVMKLKGKIDGIYREHDITELDEGIKDIVTSFNENCFCTTGSCDGHHKKYPWVDIKVNDISTLIILNHIMCYGDIGKEFNIVFDCVKHPLTYTSKEVIITIKSTHKGDKGLESFNKLKNILDNTITLKGKLYVNQRD